MPEECHYSLKEKKTGNHLDPGKVPAVGMGFTEPMFEYCIETTFAMSHRYFPFA